MKLLKRFARFVLRDELQQEKLTLQAIRRAVDATIAHWYKNVLPAIIAGEKDVFFLPVRSDSSPLCKLFGADADSTPVDLCKYCPLTHKSEDHYCTPAFGKFYLDVTPENAQAVINDLQNCKENIHRLK